MMSLRVNSNRSNVASSSGDAIARAVNSWVTEKFSAELLHPQSALITAALRLPSDATRPQMMAALDPVLRKSPVPPTPESLGLAKAVFLHGFQEKQPDLGSNLHAESVRIIAETLCHLRRFGEARMLLNSLQSLPEPLEFNVTRQLHALTDTQKQQKLASEILFNEVADSMDSRQGHPLAAAEFEFEKGNWHAALILAERLIPRTETANFLIERAKYNLALSSTLEG